MSALPASPAFMTGYEGGFYGCRCTPTWDVDLVHIGDVLSGLNYSNCDIGVLGESFTNTHL